MEALKQRLEHRDVNRGDVKVLISPDDGMDDWGLALTAESSA